MMAYQVRLYWTIGVVALALVAAGYAAVQPARSQSGTPLPGAINYQGRLTAPDGTPRNGNHAMRFLLYDQSSAGTNLWDSGLLTVPVADGLFHVDLAVNPENFRGQALWLEIIVEGETLSPRQPIRAAPYALSLRPGAVVESTTPEESLTLRTFATGTALRIEAQDRGIYAEGDNFGVYGFGDDGTGRGYGGYFASVHGAGVLGVTSGQSITLTNSFVPGVWGRSEHGVGVLGEGTGSSGTGVFGRVATGYGVVGQSDGIGMGGLARVYGVYGTTVGASPGAGYGGYFTSATGAGVHGRSTAAPSGTNLFAPGVWGYSQSGAAIYGQAGDSGAIAGYFQGNVHVVGNITATGSKVGYVADVARNDGEAGLEVGDVVVVTGVAPAVVGEIPVPTVARATTAYDRAVLGVVAGSFDPDAVGGVDETSIAPGGYLRIVTLGAYAMVKVDAQYGPIRPGDLLVTSGTSGHAKAAPAEVNPPTGTVIGKALDGWDAGTGVIPLLVNLQ